MSVSFVECIARTRSDTAFLITVLLTVGVIFVNGWTDAPNAIATCISTRALKPRLAILMAAVCNFLGVWVMSSVNVTVAFTIRNMVDFGEDTRRASIALCSALVAIVVWAVAAWCFGIPTSESHALIAGLSGAAIALQGGFSGVRLDEWGKVLVGLGVSVLLGFVLGFLVGKGVQMWCASINRTRGIRAFRHAQVFSAASMAFMHGAQDGQKFMGVFLLGLGLSSRQIGGEYRLPLWLMLLCAIVMALGTSIGGGRIIKSVGMNMVKLEPHQGFAADTAGAVSLLLLSLAGIPVSTTHTKTAAVMGVGAAKQLSAVKWAVVKEMIAAWVLTFPGCGLIGYMIARFTIGG